MFANPSRRASEPATFRAVDDVTFTVRAGEVFGIVSESGSGKTTLGKTMLRLYRPQAGTIRYAGADITTLGSGVTGCRKLPLKRLERVR